MDVELILDNVEYVRLEAKVGSDVRQRSQQALRIFGSILKGRSLQVAQPSPLPVLYGVVIPDSEAEKFRQIWSRINLCDWNDFGNRYDVKYVIHVGETMIRQPFLWAGYTTRAPTKK
jgi:hypothetical protein